MSNAFVQSVQPKGKGLKFQKIGDEHTFQITGVTERQATEYVPGGQGAPKFFPSGDPIMEQVITGLDVNAASEDEAAVALYVDKKLLRQAIGRALLEAGVNEPQSGGTLRVRHSGFGVGKNPANPPKDFEAQYWAPQAQSGTWGTGN
ncbi:hypothetical protein [Glutamicibacter creatinolyticus]|uniref:hypothetical protein n=1 Tax=Glutamicibacter creatinolyticus TaxID=162496 RepID=UPI003217180F